MKKENTSAVIDDTGQSGLSYNKMIGIYLTMCILGLIIIVSVFNGLIDRHDKQLTNEICTLISEKMDTSIKYMSTSVDEVSTIVSCYDNGDFEEGYQQLLKSIEESDYISIGLLDNDGNLYATEAEHMEFEKWNLTPIALASTNITISEPYRSSITGQLVFTMFSAINKNGAKTGTVFVTYPLEEIQNMANTTSLKDETEIWIMDGYSDNIIRCSGSDNFLIGSWSNFKLDKNRIANRPAYESWESKLRNGEYTGSVAYTLDGVAYTQVFKRIDFMPGWNVVVRIPSLSLSNTMQIFRSAIIAFAGLIIAATMVLFVFTHKREVEEKEIFEKLSTYDPLTKILNRRAFESAVEKYFRETESPVCTFMFFDVDFFKQVNDNYGHEAGDYILVNFAAALSKCYGESGLVSRYGGDEFVVLITKGSRTAVNNMTERFSEEVKKVRIESDPSFRLHFSAGMASCPDDADNLQSLMKNADDALYRVKEGGRNGWKWYKEEKK